MSTRVGRIFVWAMLLPTALAGAPTIDPVEDAKHFGPRERFLFWTPEQKVAGFRNIDRIFDTRTIAAGEHVLPLPEEPRDLGGVVLNAGDRSMTVDEYFTRQNVAGLLVLRDGKVVFERYGLGNSRDAR